MDFLWTPWRYAYISQTGPETKTESSEPNCIFCAAAADTRDQERLIVHRARHTFVILNRYPYTNGHVMVVPYAHVATLEELPDETAVEMIRLAQRTEGILRAVYKPEGLNMGINLGHCAGAGVAGHVHLHILPRWMGDANFMTTVAETRVLPEDLSSTWQKLSQAYLQSR
jgi:ATP adenylyltransferase